MERLKLKIAVYLILVKEDQILLSKRFNTGWQDGNYSLPSGHLDPDETLVNAIIRETKEEINIDIQEENLALVHTMHRLGIYIDFYFTTPIWTGEVKNIEQEKCSDLSWFPLDNLPENIVPSVKLVIENYRAGVVFSEYSTLEN